MDIASGFTSVVIQFLSRFKDAIAVVPDPQKGSNTHPLGGHDDLMILSSSFKGF